MKHDPIAECRICAKPFMRANTMQVVCSVSCARNVPIVARKQAKAELKARKDKLKTLTEWLDDAQDEVNRYVKLRDAHLGCASCDKGPNWGGQWHAGHLRSRGAAAALRFNLFNIAKQCSVCNNHLSGNAGEMRARMSARFGADKIDWLYSQNAPHKFTEEYAKRMRIVFKRKAARAKVREMEAK